MNENKRKKTSSGLAGLPIFGNIILLSMGIAVCVPASMSGQIGAHLEFFFIRVFLEINLRFLNFCSHFVSVFWGRLDLVGPGSE